MKRSFIESIVTEKALHMLNEGSYAVDLVLNNLVDESGEPVSPDSVPEIEIKNVCAKVSIKLADEIGDLCSLLGVSKRSFIEAALIDAVRRAREILDEEGVYEYLKDCPSGIRVSSDCDSCGSDDREEVAA